MTGLHLSYPQFGQTAPEARAALFGLGKATAATGLDAVVSELVKTRISQINGCAFCLAYHLKILRDHGVTQDRLDLLAVWHETELFSPAQRAALAWGEAMARLSHGTPDETLYAALGEHFSEQQIVGLNLSIATINAWNRLGVAFGFSPADAG